MAEQFALAHPREVARPSCDSVVPDANVDPLQLANIATPPGCCGPCAWRSTAASIRRRTSPPWRRRYHDGPARLDTLVAMSVGDLSSTAGCWRCTRPPPARPAALNLITRQVHAADAATAGQLSQGLHASTLCADLTMPGGRRPAGLRGAALARAVARLRPAQTWPFDSATAAGTVHPDVPVLAAGAARRAPGSARDQASARLPS